MSIGILGTEGTINGQSYVEELHRLNPNIDVCSLACPLFVPLIEEVSWTDNEITEMIAAKYLWSVIDDTIILGCTHYPLIKEALQRLLPNVCFVDSAISTALESRDHFKADGATKTTGDAEFTFLVTDNMERFVEVGYKFLKHHPKPLHLVDLTEEDAL